MRKFKFKLVMPFLLLFFFAAIAGCNESNSITNTPTTGNLSISTATNTNQQDNNVLQLSQIKIMVKHMKVETVGASGESELKTGPFVYVINMTQAIDLLSSGAVLAGNYSKVKFLIHKLGGNETSPDPEFVDNQGRYSVIVKGLWNGTPFVYKSQITAVQELTLNEAGIVSDAPRNITLQAAPYMWFDKNGIMLDPTNPDDTKEIDKNIKDNLKSELKVFWDDDFNGVED